MNWNEFWSRPFTLLKGEEVYGEGVEFSNGFCAILFHEDRPNLRAYLDFTAMWDEEVQDKSDITFIGWIEE